VKLCGIGSVVISRSQLALAESGTRTLAAAPSREQASDRTVYESVDLQHLLACALAARKAQSSPTCATYAKRAKYPEGRHRVRSCLVGLGDDAERIVLAALDSAAYSFG